MEADSSSPCQKKKRSHRRVKCTFKQKMLQKVCPFAALCNVQEFKRLQTRIIRKNYALSKPTIQAIKL
jgi:hypothetical protein